MAHLPRSQISRHSSLTRSSSALQWPPSKHWAAPGSAKTQMAVLSRVHNEHPFGTLKQWMGAAHFLTRKLAGVSAEMSLNVFVYNLKRALKIFGTHQAYRPRDVTEPNHASFMAPPWMSSRAVRKSIAS